MASWRVKGYVSDSEDEDGGVDISDKILIEQKLLAPSGILISDHTSDEAVIDDAGTAQQNGGVVGLAEKSEASLLFHLPDSRESPAPLNTADIIQESLQQALTTLNDQAGVQDDSPLSSPPDSPQLPPSIGRILPDQEDFSVVEQPILAPAAQRTFRQRTANQLQPYTIDRAKHIQEWSALGIKPVALPRSRSPVIGAPKSATEDSQFEESQSQSQVGESISQDLMDLDPPLESSQPTERGMYDVTFEDELPDLASLLQRRSPRSMKKSKRSTILFDGPSSDSDHLSSAKRRQKTIQKDQQDSLPSPPPSLNDDLLRPADLVENRESSPPAIPSSTSRPRKRLVIEDDTQSTDGERTTNSVRVVHIRDDTSSDESVPEKEAAQVMQKRIKGVLPASWWTVEMAQQALAAKKKQISRQHASRIPHAGVAQRKISTQNQPRQTRAEELEELLSDETSENEAPENHVIITPADVRRNLDSPSRANTPADDVDGMDVVEENEIDFMLAPQSRRRVLDGKSHARSSASAIRRIEPQDRRQYQQSLDRGTQNRQTKRVKAKSTAGRVHVLDAPDLRSPKQHMPSFLRVAARQAKSKPKSAGIPLSRKFFHLDSDDDSLAHGLDPHPPSTSHQKRDFASSTAKKHFQEKRHSVCGGLSKIASGTNQVNKRGDAEKHRDRHPSPDVANVDHKNVELGHLIQCGPTDDAALRLTHLRSLLPMTNRSGHGKFATHHRQPREAQLETLQTVTGLPVRPRQRIISTTRSTPATRQDSGHAAKDVNYEPNPSESAVKHRERKQVPVQRQRLRQRSLVPPSPDTKDLANLIGRTDPAVRDTLEREFNTHQAAWFQASRQNIIYSNQETQQHFYTFLDVLKSYLPMALQDAEDERESRELRSFIHRLIPNRGQIGASGQVGNKTKSVHHYDVLVAQNVFELHKWLLSLAPGAAPRPRVLEMKVNFADAHEEICLIALSTWKDICQMHINDLEIIHGLAAWLYSMLHQLANRWVAAETDAQKEIASLTHLTDSDVVRHTVEHNQKRVCTLFCKVLETFAECIQEATSVTEARSLFSVNNFVQALGHLNSIDKLNSNIAEALFMAAAAYVSLPWMPAERSEVVHLVEATHKSFVVATSSQSLSYTTTHSLTKSFFTIAKAAIDQGQITWDHLLTPAAHLSLERLDHRQQNIERQNLQEQNLTTIKAVFYYNLIEKATSQYELELRPTIISFWVMMLLEAKEQDQHWRLLTLSLFRHEMTSLRMSLLASKFCGSGSIDDNVMHDISVSELRYAIVLHIITILHEQEKAVEAEDVPGGFESRDAKALMDRMFVKLRENWQSLPANADQKELYTLLIHAALRQFELYPRQDIVIDSWFYNAATFPQSVRNDLFQILGGSNLLGDTTMNKAAELFDLEIEQASRFDHLETFESKLRATLIQQHWVNGHEITPHMLVEHGKFFRLTIEAYVNGSSVSNGVAAEILVRVLTYLMCNLHCRAEADDPQLLKGFMQSISPILSSLRALLSEASVSFKTNIFELTGLIHDWTVAVLHDIPDIIVEDLEAICEIASEDNSPQSLLLLEAVMTIR